MQKNSSSEYLELFYVAFSCPSFSCPAFSCPVISCLATWFVKNWLLCTNTSLVKLVKLFLLLYYSVSTICMVNNADYFHVLHFHALLLGPSFSCNAFSALLLSLTQISIHKRTAGQSSS